MRKGLVLVVVAVLAAVSAGVAFGKTVRVGAKASGTSVSLVRGDKLQIKLASNPSTGYSWKILTVTRSMLKPVSSTYKGTARLPGAGGAQTFVFRGLARGTSQLT